MIFRSTVGIVLARTDYSHTSNIVTFYTRHHGKIRAVAKGARRKKSEFLGILEPLSLLEIVYIEGRSGLHILKEAYLIDSNIALRAQLSRLVHGLYFLSLVDRSQPEGDADPAIFELLSSSLSTLKRFRSPENVPAIFQLRLLDRFGRLPSLTKCGQCASPLTGTAYYDNWSAGLFCATCGKGGNWALPQGTVQALKRLAHTSLERSGRIRLSKKQRFELSRLLRAMLRSAIEEELPAQAVVDSLLS